MSPVLKTARPPDVDEKKAASDAAGKEESKDRDDLAKQKTDRGRGRDLAPAAKAGSARGGARQNQTNQNYGQMSVTRTVGGRVFSNRDGAWYDSAYQGQPTTNYRRGTDEYKKLDKGLRQIADSLSGTVVVVWKSKPYRIL